MLLRAALHPPNTSNILLRTFSSTPSLASRIRPGHPHPQSSATSAAFLALTASTSAAPGGRVPKRGSPFVAAPVGLRAQEEGAREATEDTFASPSFESLPSSSSSTASQILAAQRSLLNLSSPTQTPSFLDLTSLTESSSSSSPPSFFSHANVSPNFTLPILSPPAWGVLEPSTTNQDIETDQLLADLKPNDASTSPADHHTSNILLSRSDSTAQASAEIEMLYALRRQLALTVLTPTGDRKVLDGESLNQARWSSVGGLEGRGRIRPSFGEQMGTDEGEKVLQMDSVKRKRKKMMAKHKRRKRRRETRTERRKLGK